MPQLYIFRQSRRLAVVLYQAANLRFSTGTLKKARKRAASGI
jgi:hypothetical protein